MSKSWDILIHMNSDKYSFLDYRTTSSKHIKIENEYKTLNMLNKYVLKDIDMDNVMFLKRNVTIEELKFFNRIRVIL